MSPSSSSREPSHFEVLSLTPNSLDGQDSSTQAKTVKQAYRRALLKHHPDKNQQAKAQDSPSDPAEKSKKDKKNGDQHFTVDQITEAFTVLSDTRQRREYVRSMQTESRSSTTSGNGVSSSSHHKQDYTYKQTFNYNGSSSGSQQQKPAQQQQARPHSSSGVETVDLDDVRWDGKRQVYHQACGRCGTDRGYCFRELDLDEVGEDGELMVQCTGCSLWLRVLFDEEEEEEEEGGDEQGTNGNNNKDVKSQRSGSQQGEELRHTHSGSSSGKSGGWSWKFNFGISIGGGASASASAGRK
jgi:diphthamide biosynthesis protein 4